MQRYNKGDKVKTTDTWNNGFGTIIPKGSIVTVILDNARNGVMCEYNNKEIFYEYEWLGDVVEKVCNMKEFIDKLIERLEIEIIGMISDMPDGAYLKGNVNFSVIAREIVNELAEEYVK